MRIMSGIIITVTLLMLVLAGCGSNGNSPVSSDEPNGSGDKTVTIKIGNITDLTGPGANGMELVNLGLEDAARYYNENNVIPGVEFEVVHWDGQLDSSRTIPGYEWLLHKGVDFMTTCAPEVAVVLKSRAEADKVVLFTQVGELEAIEPPGYVFCLGSIPQYEAYTLLSWIAENDWDYERNGPAKIGAAAWAEPYANGFVQAMKDYAEAHPDQFEFVGGYLTNFTFNWSNEAESLRECDYVFPPLLVHGFAEDIRNAGSSAKLVGASPHTAFLKQVGDAGAWPAIDGMLFIYAGLWWNETGEDIDFQKSLLAEYHPGEEEEIMSRGSGYAAIGPYLMMFDIVAKAVETTGPDGLNSEAIYDAAQSWSDSLDEGERGYSYSPTKRYILNVFDIIEASAEQQTLVRNDPNWYPILTEP